MKSRYGNSRLHFSTEKVSSLNGAAEQLVKTKKIGCDVTADHMLTE